MSIGAAAPRPSRLRRGGSHGLCLAGAPCLFTLDPASLLVTSHFDEGIPELPPQWLIHEYYQDDVNKLADVARSRHGISTLHEATGGDPTSSPRWHFNIALGGDQELIAALRTPSGEVWGGLGLYRETGQSMFDDQELAFVQAVAPSLAEGHAGRCGSAR